MDIALAGCGYLAAVYEAAVVDPWRGVVGIEIDDPRPTLWLLAVRCPVCRALVSH